MKLNDIVVFSEDSRYDGEVDALAKELNITRVLTPDELKKAPLALCLGDGGLFLTDNVNSIQADFSRLAQRMKKGVVDTELVVRAARIKKASSQLTVLDATAGFGEDAALLAAAGFKVNMYENDAVIAALLRDALRRAADTDIPQLTEAASRMELVCGDSIEAMRKIAMRTGDSTDEEIAGIEGAAKVDNAEKFFVPDIIYLDPMFPERRKSALIKKKFQLLQKLETPCENEEELLAAALAAKPRRIVIKRPAKGAFLAGQKPSYSLAGKAVRYDVIILP